MEPNGLACGDEDGEDRISQLPDPLLHHIISLSSMTTREVVQSTSTLSKRWKNLWASMPFLSFYHYEFYKRDEEDDEEQGKGRFERFVNAVLLLRDKSDVQKFQLRWTRLISSCTKRHFATWIQYAANHNVKSLDIKVDLDVNIFTLPHFIFNCRYLEELKLGFVCIYVDIIPPKFMGLDRLRKLHLNHFDINRDSLQKLLSGCPVLEELQFTKGMLREPDISSKVLKRLTVRKCSIKGTVIRISSPSLMYLSFICNDIERSQVRLENLSSLVEASFQTDDYAGEDLYEQIPETIKFIESIPGKERDKTFHNLKKLELFAESMSANFHAVTHLLQRSPNLEKLKLCHVEYGEPTEGKELSWVFDCPHLYMDIQIQCDTPCHSLNGDLDEMLRYRTSRARRHTMVLIPFTIRQMVQTLSSSFA